MEQMNCSRKMREKETELAEKNKKIEDPDFAETVELCFKHGPRELRRWSRFVKFLVNFFICLTQLGFCCIYIVFISMNYAQVSFC